jgi:hypothetical protein
MSLTVISCWHLSPQLTNRPLNSQLLCPCLHRGYAERDVFV